MSMRDTIMAALVTAYETMLNDPITYNLAFRQIYDHAVAANTISKADAPCLMIIDAGDEEQVVHDGTNYQYLARIGVNGVVRCDTADTIHREASRLVSDVRTFIDSSPTIHAQVLAYRFVDLQRVQHSLLAKGKSTMATITIVTALRYYCASGGF